MYLIRIVISFIWVAGIFPLACDFNMLNKKRDTTQNRRTEITVAQEQEDHPS